MTNEELEDLLSKLSQNTACPMSGDVCPICPFRSAYTGKLCNCGTRDPIISAFKSGLVVYLDGKLMEVVDG